MQALDLLETALVKLEEGADLEEFVEDFIDDLVEDVQLQSESLHCVAHGPVAQGVEAGSHPGHEADCVGDVGATSGGLLAACAVQAFARDYAPARRALLWTSADDQARAAVCIETPDSGS